MKKIVSLLSCICIVAGLALNGCENNSSGSVSGMSEENNSLAIETEGASDIEEDMWETGQTVEVRQTFIIEGESREDKTSIPIRTAEDLRNIEANSSERYILMNDIDMEGKTKSIVRFRGVFDGNYHQIKNASGPIFFNIFGGTVCNLAVVDTTSSSAGIVAELFGGTIINCYVTGEIGKESDSYTGGIVAEVPEGEIRILDCYNSADVYGYGSKEASGGIVGKIGAKNTFIISECENYGTISGYNAFGTAGICGGIAFDSPGNSCSLAGTIERCTNYGTVEGIEDEKEINSGVHSGLSGILGDGYVQASVYDTSLKLNICECSNYGQISKKAESKRPTGGICGSVCADQYSYTTTTASIMFSDCFNAAEGIAGICGEVEACRGSIDFLRCINLTKFSYPIYQSKIQLTSEMDGYITINDSYCLSDSGEEFREGATALSSEQMRDKEIFSESGFDLGFTWGMEDGVNNGYPYIMNYEQRMEREELFKEEEEWVE